MNESPIIPALFSPPTPRLFPHFSDSLVKATTHTFGLDLKDFWRAERRAPNENENKDDENENETNTSH